MSDLEKYLDSSSDESNEGSNESSDFNEEEPLDGESSSDHAKETKKVKVQYECERCEKHYTTMQGYSRHMAKHNVKEKGLPHPHYCPYCKKGFIRADHCNTHKSRCKKKNARGGKPKKCETFVTASQFESALQSIMKMQTKKKQCKPNAVKKAHTSGNIC